MTKIEKFENIRKIRKFEKKLTITKKGENKNGQFYNLASCKN